VGAAARVCRTCSTRQTTRDYNQDPNGGAFYVDHRFRGYRTSIEDCTLTPQEGNALLMSPGAPPDPRESWRLSAGAFRVAEFAQLVTSRSR
jgi:hypothetical protein